MSLSVSFSYSQSPLTPGKITFADETTGTDVTITQRRIYIALTDRTYLVPAGTTTDYIVWGSYPSITTILVDCLSKDRSATVTIDWCTVSGTAVYSFVMYCGFTRYNENFDYLLTQMASANDTLLSDNNFMGDKYALRTDIESGNNAILNYYDVSGAQLLYDMATELRLNSQYYFNINS